MVPDSGPMVTTSPIRTALEQNDQAGDEVGEDFLQAKTQTNTERGDQPLQLVPADAKGYSDDTRPKPTIT